MTNTRNNHIVSVFEQRYNTGPAAIVSAPGRINLIGEHTDYTGGFVLPVAIDRDVTIAFSPRKDDLVRVYSMDFDDEIEIHLVKFENEQNRWAEYIQGMAWALIDAGYPLSGWQGIVSGNIPIGAGMSSSAALEIAAGMTFCLASHVEISPTKLALIAQKAERDWVGVNVGIMDQLISAAGRADHAMLLDCRSLAFDFVPIPDQLSFIVLDTLTRRELTHSAYNTRQEEVIEATKYLGLESIRAVNLELLQQKQTTLPGVLYRRVRHIVTENDRVNQFAEAMRNIDFIMMGELINSSHASLRDDFEVSSDALNLMVNLAQNHHECLGARMMGAGFGGCALALLRKGAENVFTRDVSATYQEKTEIEPNIFIVISADGVRVKPFS